MAGEQGQGPGVDRECAGKIQSDSERERHAVDGRRRRFRRSTGRSGLRSGYARAARQTNGRSGTHDGHSAGNRTPEGGRPGTPRIGGRCPCRSGTWSMTGALTECRAAAISGNLAPERWRNRRDRGSVTMSQSGVCASDRTAGVGVQHAPRGGNEREGNPEHKFRCHKSDPTAPWRHIDC